MPASAKDVFEFRSYKEFLRSRVGPPGSRTGVKGAMARALRCQATYVSQVLGGRAQFSLEQGEALADFFGLTDEQKHFFLLLLQRERAGTRSLERYFDRQVEEVLARRMVLTARLGKENSLSAEDQSIYYSAWAYAAVHIALTIPSLRSPRTLARALGLPLRRVNEVLDFLVRSGLAVKKGERFDTGVMQIRLGRDSHNIIKHHTNWRNRAVESLDRESVLDLHYSAVFSLAREDIPKVKDRLLEFIGETVRGVRESKEEELYGFCLDLFDVIRHGATE